MLHSLKYLRFFPPKTSVKTVFTLTYGICDRRRRSKAVLSAAGKENTEGQISQKVSVDLAEKQGQTGGKLCGERPAHTRLAGTPSEPTELRCGNTGSPNR